MRLIIYLIISFSFLSCINSNKVNSDNSEINIHKDYTLYQIKDSISNYFPIDTSDIVSIDFDACFSLNNFDSFKSKGYIKDLGKYFYIYGKKIDDFIVFNYNVFGGGIESFFIFFNDSTGYFIELSTYCKIVYCVTKFRDLNFEIIYEMRVNNSGGHLDCSHNVPEAFVDGYIFNYKSDTINNLIKLSFFDAISHISHTNEMELRNLDYQIEVSDTIDSFTKNNKFKSYFFHRLGGVLSRAFGDGE
jgi:hypothetical protein